MNYNQTNNNNNLKSNNFAQSNPSSLKELFDNSVPIDLSVTTGSVLNNLAEEVYLSIKDSCFEGSRKPTLNKQQKLKANVQVILANLFLVNAIEYSGIGHNRQMYLSIDRMPSKFSAIVKRYRSKDISYSYLIKKVLDQLISRGWVCQVTGYKPVDPKKDGMRSRIKATGWLKDQMNLINQRCELNPFAAPDLVVLSPDAELIKLKNEDKQLIDYQETPEVEAMRSNVKRYNDYLRKSVNIAVNGTPRTTGMYLYRIFNNSSFEQGGRFYGGIWQCIKSDERPLLTINGEPTVELDYSSLHITALYHLRLNMDVPEGDLYCLAAYGIGKSGDPIARKVAKLAALIMFNASTKIKAIYALDKELSALRKDGAFIPWDSKQIIKAFTQKHSALREYFCSGYGLQLQKMDSMIVDQILVKSVDANIPVLPVHDSFIVRERDQEWLLEIMKNEYEVATGFKPRVHAA